MLKALIKRFDEHESTTRDSIASLQQHLTSQIDAHETSRIASQQFNHALLDTNIAGLENIVSRQAREVLEEIENMRCLVYEGVTTLRAGTSALGRDVRTLRRIVDSNISGQVPHAFPQFQRLPIEVRRMIWEWATPGKILEVRQYNHVEFTPHNLTFEFVGNCSPPATAQICRESRDVACRRGKLVSLDDSPLTPGNGPEPVYLGQDCPVASWGRKRWAWFDSYKDSLYLRTEEFLSQGINLQDVRHVILPRQGCEGQISQLLTREICPHLTSIQLVCASVEWPMQTDSAFETAVWGDDYHIPIQTKKGDVAEAKRVHDGLSKLLDPQPGFRFNMQRARIQRLVDVVAAQDPWDGAQHKAYSERILQYWSERGLPAKSKVKALKEMVEKSMFRCIWMLSRTTDDRIQFPPWLITMLSNGSET